MTGTKIWNYRVREKLGEGGMGVVYRAEDLRVARIVALKFLSATLRTDAWARDHFCCEARAGALVNHPNVCRVYDFVEEGPELFIAMALIEGQGLASYVARNGRCTAQILGIAAQIADALAAVHRCGVIHLDVKPSNVIVGLDSQAVLIDFGLASVPDPRRHTPEKTTAGTVAYMSPEQVAGDVIDCRSDIWSLGVVLYELLAGHPPFRGEYRQAIEYSVLNEEPDVLTVVGEPSDVSSGVKTILQKALAKKPWERYSSADALAADLRHLSDFAAHFRTVRPCVTQSVAIQ